MIRSESLKKNQDFQIVYQQGTSGKSVSGDVRTEKSVHEESSGNISKQKSREQCGTPQNHQIDKRKLSLK